jgi:hypothetical protein
MGESTIRPDAIDSYKDCPELTRIHAIYTCTVRHIAGGCFERTKTRAAFELSFAVSPCATHFYRTGGTLKGFCIPFI